MKRVISGIILGIALLSFGSASAQVGTSMQFNQVLIKTFNGVSPTYTVPAGKIWKLEGAVGGSVYIQTINGNTISGLINTPGTSNGGENLPMWLPENTTISFWENGNNATVSIIEFTVLP